jgi:hypothetical protein
VGNGPGIQATAFHSTNFGLLLERSDPEWATRADLSMQARSGQLREVRERRLER